MNQTYKKLIPALSAEEYEGLEQSILSEGCRDAIIIWGDTIIDGHNRYEICSKHGIEFRAVQKEFADETDAKIWIIRNQFGRRNLTPPVRIELARELKSIWEEKARKNLSETGKAVAALTNQGLATWPKVAEPVNTREELAKDALVSPRTFARAERVMDDSPELWEKVKEGEETINSAYKKTTAKAKKEKRIDSIKEKALETTTKYPVIYADPPWKYDYAEAGNREIENQYPTMDVDSICNLPVAELATDNAVLYLWATAPKIREALKVIYAWGFEYKTHAIWDKNKIGMGYWFRGQHELLMVATKGSFPPPDSDKRVSSVIRETRTEHSKKPDVVYSIIESAYPDLPKIELFCRQSRDKWTAWGNQI